MALSALRRHALALALPGAISLAALARLEPPAARSDPATPATEFSAARALALVRELTADGSPRPVGSAAGDRAVETLVGALRAAGLDTSVQEAFACGPYGTCARVRNVVGRLAGSAPDRRAVLLVAHHDSVAAGPGVADDLSGVAAAVEVARAVAAGPPLPRPLLVLLTDGEESALIGASAFVERHPAAAQLGAVINLEARGTTGPSIAFETSGAPTWVGRVLRALPRPVTTSLAEVVYRRLLPNDTDLTVFERAGVPGVNLAFAFGAVRYHTPRDDLPHLDARSVQHHGDGALALVRALAAEDLEARAQGERAWFDLLGLTVISWPAPRGVALVAALGAVLAALSALRTAPRPARAAARGIAAALLALLLAAGAMALLLAALRATGAIPRRFVASPAPIYVAAWAAGAAGALLGPALASGRVAQPAAMRAGAALLFAALSAGLGLALPSASHLGAIPAAACAIAAAGREIAPRDPRVAVLLDALPAAAAAIVLAPPALLLGPVLGTGATPLCAMAVALLLLPATAAASEGRRRVVPGLTALVAALALAAVQAALPHATRGAPEQLTFVFHEEDGRARWLAEAERDTLPAAVREAAPFSARREEAFPWAPIQSAFSAPAAPLGLRPPRLEVLSSRSDAGLRHVRARISSPYGAPVVLLLIPPDAPVAAVSVEGVALGDPPPQGRALWGGHRLVGSMTTPLRGVTVELTIRGDDPLEVLLVGPMRSLPQSGEALVSARPPTAVPSREGDATVVVGRVRL